MDETTLPSGSELRRRISMIGFAVGIPSVAVVMLYIQVLLGFDSDDWVRFIWAFLPISVLTGCSAEIWLIGAMKPIVRWLDSRDAAAQTEEKVLAAFESVISLPSGYQRATSLGWVVAAAVAPIIMTLLDSQGWGFGFQSFVVVVAGSSGALVSSISLQFAVKRALEDVRVEIATLIEDPEERRRRIRPIPISRKMSISMVGTVTTLLVFTMTLSYSRAGASIDELAIQWQVRVLDALAAEVDEERPLEDAIRSLTSQGELLPYPVEFEILHPGGEGELEGEDGDVRRHILGHIDEGEGAGSRARLHQSAVWAWHQLGDGSILTLRVPRSALRSGFAGFARLLLGVLLASVGIAWLLSALMSGDVWRATEALRVASERMARGDLRRGRIFESEDELGDLWRSFELMGGALRTTVKSLAEAADRVDAATGEIASAAEGVAEASADQVRRIRQASGLMVDINNQVMEVSNSAQALNVSVEESSSSILELGAASDELNDTASTLGSKVDDVSSSIEEMVRSVQQVSSSSDGLSEAAAETSASMEEMASAMRAVDNTAEMTAGLSRDVVGSAEAGQERVSQTIASMQTISDVTATAERVIRGLGAGAKEIGAIVDVIDDVADETNLLALNAAIIAAQAGEQGKAFSVVADEIKELADRVLSSTKEIGALIRNVQEESENAVGAIEEGSRSVASGVELSAEAGVSLEEITRSSRESGRHIGEIVSAVREQTKAASHVVALMDKVRDGVEQIGVASAEQNRGNEVVFRSSVTMREVAQQVRRTTEEQSRGFGRIRESVEGVREAVENINGSLQEQSSACSQVAGFLEQVSEQTRSNESAAHSMGESIRALGAHAEALRDDVAKFRI